ncbi:YfdX family protein [Pseudorhodobacter sp. W20_MBD10_FR17]|uniref:YfdX family protein n=1 Tax=Pseudorhodobacter sp. W20_MBD10_FR17 TaxID=3240266 RepID=UPI003F9AA7EF
MKASNKFIAAALAGLVATSSFGSFAAYAAGTDAKAPTAAYATQKELLKTADEALSTVTHVRAARMALFDNKIDEAKANVADATKALSAGETDLKALLVADSDKADAAKAFLPFDMSMALTDTFKPTQESEKALKEAKGLMTSGEKDKAIEVLRVASVDLNISAALLPEQGSLDKLKQATDLLEGQEYFAANLALKSIEDSVVVRNFGIDAIPAQGNIE